MARANKKTPAPVEIEQDLVELEAIAAIDEQIALPNSVVKPKYKIRYKQLAQARGGKGKAEKRMNGDWLSVQLKGLVLTKQEKLDLEKLRALCDANGVDVDRWTNRAPGWEGRLRMTASLVLRKIVADDEVLHVPGEDDRIPTPEFVSKYRSL